MHRKLFWHSFDNPAVQAASTLCTTVNGAHANQPCVFPFTFRGVKYNVCTVDGDAQGQLWCSTKTDAQGNHITGHWGHCADQCPQTMQTLSLGLWGSAATSSINDVVSVSTTSPIPNINRWPFSEIPYELPPSMGGSVGELASLKRIIFAMSHYHRHTSIRFVKRTGQKNYVQFVWGNTCSSWIGLHGGPQKITLTMMNEVRTDLAQDAGAGCSVGDIVHELGHAVGFQHEHQRTDRDKFVRINMNNVRPGSERSYVKKSVKIDINHYDYGSIMHYEPVGALSTTGQPIIEVVPTRYEEWKQLYNNGNDVAIGQKDGLSHLDVKSIDDLYRQCIDHVGVPGGVRCEPGTEHNGHCWRTSSWGECTLNGPCDWDADADCDNVAAPKTPWAKDTCRFAQRYRQAFCISATTGKCAPSLMCESNGNNNNKPPTSVSCREDPHDPRALQKNLNCDFDDSICKWQNGFYAYPHWWQMGSDIAFTLMAGNHYEATSPHGASYRGGIRGRNQASGYLFFNTKHLSSVKKMGEKAHLVSPPFNPPTPDQNLCLHFHHHLKGVGQLSVQATTCSLAGRDDSAGDGSGNYQWVTLWDSVSNNVQRDGWHEAEVPLGQLSLSASTSTSSKSSSLWERGRQLFWTESPSAQPQPHAVGTSTSSMASMAQIRFTAKVGSRPSQSDLGIDRISIGPCSVRAVPAGLTLSPAAAAAPVPGLESTSTQAQTTITTVGGPKSGELCVFPFIYTPKVGPAPLTIWSCTAIEDPKGGKWCSTKVSEGKHVAGNWGYCPP